MTDVHPTSTFFIFHNAIHPHPTTGSNGAAPLPGTPLLPNCHHRCRTWSSLHLNVFLPILVSSHNPLPSTLPTSCLAFCPCLPPRSVADLLLLYCHLHTLHSLQLCKSCVRPVSLSHFRPVCSALLFPAHSLTFTFTFTPTPSLPTSTSSTPLISDHIVFTVNIATYTPPAPAPVIME
jgi:hypothetical protein